MLKTIIAAALAAAAGLAHAAEPIKIGLVAALSGPSAQSGEAITRGLAIVTQSAGHIESMVKRRARTALTSGGTEPVLDAGGGAHSVFAKAFLETLQGNAGILDGQSAFQQVSEQVRLNAEQEPTYDNIRLAGHDGGDFLFVRKR